MPNDSASQSVPATSSGSSANKRICIILANVILIELIVRRSKEDGPIILINFALFHLMYVC